MEPRRGVALVGAPSNIGIKPYEDGQPRGLDRAPAVLRDHGLVARIGALDAGDVPAPPYEDLVRPAHGVRNERALVAYNRALADRVAAAGADGRFLVLVGGDCSIVLGAVLAARRLVGAAVGLAYIDGHADFAMPEESATGSAASMCLAMVAGRGDTDLARLSANGPLVASRDLVLLGRRDDGEPYGHDGLRALHVRDIPYAEICARGRDVVVAETRAVLEREELGGFWVHVDADVLDASVMPAVDSPTSGGPDVDELVELVSPLVGHPRALGLQLTIYDPALDGDRTCAERLVQFLERTLSARS